jgi:trimethylamine--corrinoid protein Co-methyltransferase
MTLRVIKGIEPGEDFPTQPLFEELLREKHLLIADHTRKFVKREEYFPGPVINRANRMRWEEEGSPTLHERAQREIERMSKSYKPSRLPDDAKRELTKLMQAEARRYGMKELPPVQ